MTYNMLSNIPWTWFIYKLESKYKKTGNIIKSEFPCLVLEAVWTQFEAVWNSFKYRNNGEERSFFGNSKLKVVSRKSYTDVPKNLGSQRSKRICNWNLEIHFIKNTNMTNTCLEFIIMIFSLYVREKNEKHKTKSNGKDHLVYELFV